MTGGSVRALPPLTKPQLARLVEIALFPTTGRTDIKPVATETLRCLGLIELGRTIKGGLCEVIVTPPGTRVLAGFPGDEFDRFRAALAAQENPDADR